MTTAYPMCPLCEASCGLEVEHDGRRILAIRGDARDPFSKGYICPKAVALRDVHDDPDRLRMPQRRVGDRFVDVPWDEALDEATARLTAIQKTRGRDAVGLYIGNPTAHSYSALLTVIALVRALGTHNVFTSNSVDSLPRQLTSFLMYGSPVTIPVPDLDRTDYLLILGANPAVSNGSALVAPNCRQRIKDIRARGGEVDVVDPRRTETAALATRHFFIRPGADALFLAALVRCTLEDARPGSKLRVSKADLGVLADALAPFSPERVAPHVGITAERIRAVATRFGSANRAVCYGRLGTCTQEFGTLATWLVDALNIVTGNFDEPGGAMFAKPPIDLAALAGRLGLSGTFGRWRSRVGNLPEFNGELPVAALADEMETNGPGQIRALVTHAGNPALSLPNGKRIEAALSKLDFMVAIDIYRNETTRFADLILPPTFGLEHDHYPLVAGALAVRNMAKYSRAVLETPGGSKHDWQILMGLASRLVAARHPLGKTLMVGASSLGRHIAPKDLIRLAIRLGPFGKGLAPLGRGLSLADLEANPHGTDLGPLEPRLSEVLQTKSGRIQLTPRELLDDMRRLRARLDGTASDRSRDTLLLIGRRDLRSNNSWMHNSQRLVKGRDRCTLLMHPSDAKVRGIETGAAVVLSSRVGALRVNAELSDEMMPGVVSLPHGWGHDREGTQLGVASQRPGVSVNDITDDAFIDELSGCSSLTGVPVDVAPAADHPEL